MFHGFGYEAVLIYHTNSQKRPETHLLYHDSTDGKAAVFGKSSNGETYRRLFARWIKGGNSMDFFYNKKWYLTG